MKNFFGKIGKVGELIACLIAVTLVSVAAITPIFGTLLAIYSADNYSDSQKYNDYERAGLILFAVFGQGFLSIIILILVGKYYEVL